VHRLQLTVMPSGISWFALQSLFKSQTCHDVFHIHTAVKLIIEPFIYLGNWDAVQYEGNSSWFITVLERVHLNINITAIHVKYLTTTDCMCVHFQCCRWSVSHLSIDCAQIRDGGIACTSQNKLHRISNYVAR